MADNGKPKILVFGGSGPSSGEGPENLVRASRLTKPGKLLELEAQIVGFVSMKHGGLAERARRLGVRFIRMEPPLTADAYAAVMRDTGAEWAACSGWPRYVCGIDPARTFNIHPAPLKWRDRLYGGHHMYGDAVHEFIASEIASGRETCIGISMHFVVEAEENEDMYDKGPVFFQHTELFGDMEPTMENVKARVRKLEHRFQPRITNLVVNGQIRWDGKDPKSLVVPPELLKAA